MSLQDSKDRGPHPINPDGPAYDFQDTYEGLGDFEDADALNSETFGVGNIGKDFNFSGSGRHGKEEENVTRVSYARVAANDDDFMKDLWGVPSQTEAKHSDVSEDRQDKKFLSLEEIEAQLMENPPQSFPEGYSTQQHQLYGASYPPTYYGNYVVPQPGFIPPPGQFAMPGAPQFMPMQHPGGMMMYNGARNPNASVPHEPLYFHPQAPGPLPMKVPMPVDSSVETKGSHQTLVSRDVKTEPIGPTDENFAKNELNDFPVLGSQTLSSRKDGSFKTPSQNRRTESELPAFASDEATSLSAEQKAQLARRQEKVTRIMRYSGIMNPKDKDFVTRFQLSQIVTEDPYNEDFYAQVYRVIHPNLTPGALVPYDGDQQPNSVAQAYLDQSGHRLGGRFKRADVALQRMQQQVQKAVSVAKERQSLPHHERVGVLGKISVGSGKKPRQQLSILSKAAQKAKEDEESSHPDQDPSGKKQSTAKSSNKETKNRTKKDIMAILENIINNLISVENDSRSSSKVNLELLWDSLHVLDHSPSSEDGEPPINPFIQCLNHEKALKILPRLFKFLTREQTLTIVTLIMANLENLVVIKEGSYTTYADRKVPAKVAKLIELYSLIFCKVLMNSVQDFKFHEIIGLLVILIQHNVVSFVSTTKIGLSILTSLLSRAELIRGEGTISATDLSEWTSCYDELFTSLESRIAAIFPPNHGDSQNDYVWQFLATLSLGGKLSHQRIIVDEVRDEIFGVMNRAKAIPNSDMARLHEKQNMLNNLNMYLVVMGLVANENEILELKN